MQQQWFIFTLADDPGTEIIIQLAQVTAILDSGGEAIVRMADQYQYAISAEDLLKLKQLLDHFGRRY